MKQNKGYIHEGLYYKYIDSERAVLHKTNEVSITEADWQMCKGGRINWITFVLTDKPERWDLSYSKAIQYGETRPSMQGDTQRYWSVGLFTKSKYEHENLRQTSKAS